MRGRFGARVAVTAVVLAAVFAAAFAAVAVLAAIAAVPGPTARGAPVAAAAQGAPPSRLGEWFDGETAGGFAQATVPRRFAFPSDHGPHPEFQHEWWYLSGNLDGAHGERFGFELTFFRFALAPVAAQPGSSAWRARTIYMAHFAVTDAERRRFRFAQKLSREALGLAGAEGQPLRVWIDDWFLTAEEGSSERPAAPARAAASAPAASALWRVHAAQAGYEIELALEPETDPVLEGDAGLSRKADAPSAASYYYSIPRLAVRGRLFRDGEPLAVRGEAWLDREWSSGGLGPQQTGWDWFALQLEDGSSLMFYALRDIGGRRDAHSAGSWINPAGERRALADADVAIAVTDTWRSSSGERYPAGWRLRVPALALELSVRPLLADQELRTTPRYWEGAVEVEGVHAGRSVRGRGYVELVGYARER